MRVNLNEVPPEGQNWILNQKTGELNESLKDLIGNQAFSAEFTLLHLSPGTFDLKGFIRTEMPEECSRCALDFNLEISEVFHELLMPQLDTPRDAKFAKANHFSDLINEGPTVVEYTGHIFEAGEYFHELLALGSPFQPKPAETPDGKCSACGINVRNQVFSYDEPMPEVETPFDILKKIKV